jgi:hypothetical protein
MRASWPRMRGWLALPEPAREDPRPSLVYLVWAPFGVEPTRVFAEALRRHPAGIDHELVLAMNGFTSAAAARPHLEALGDLEPTVLLFAEDAFDMGTYYAAAARLRRRRYCFVNSNSRPLVDGWLAKLDAALDLPGVGQVGATGAWASGHSWMLYSAGLPSVYKGLMPLPPVARELAREIDAELGSASGGSARDAIRARLSLLLGVPRTLFCYPPFPSRFLRTNTFMIEHDTLRRLRVREIHKKTHTYSLEGSRWSVTRQLQRLGLTSLVVDRAGDTYVPEQWHRSRTFWQGDQEGLLVADNRTLSYANGGLARRKLLSTLAWGPMADPRLPREDRAQ